MSKYLLVPKPNFNESITGFILRLSKDNLYDRTKWVFQNANLIHDNKIKHIYNCNRNHPSIRKLAYATNMDTKEIENLTFLPLFGDYNESEEFIDITLGANIHRLNFKFCPDCLKSKLYLRKVWDLHQYNICHIHNCVLINKCTFCGWRFNISSLSDFECMKCSYPFNKMKSGASSNKVAVVDFIFSRINEKNLGSKKNNYLYTIDFKIALFILINLSSKLHQKIKKRLSFDSVEDNILRNNLLVEVFSGFEDFPNSFYSFLNNYYSIQNITENNKNGGLQKTFGYLIDDIENKFKKTESLQFLYDSFNTYIRLYWEGNVLSSRGKNSEYMNEEWIFRNDAKDILGVTIYTLENLINNGVLISKKVVRGKEHTLVSKKSIFEYKESVKEQKKVNLALTRYSLSERQINVLIHLGVLKKGKNHNGFKRVDPGMLFNFFNDLNLKAKRFVNDSDDNYISFNHAVRKYCKFRKGLLGIFSDILNNKVSIYSANEEITSISEIFFENKEISQLANIKYFKTKKI